MYYGNSAGILKEINRKNIYLGKHYVFSLGLLIKEGSRGESKTATVLPNGETSVESLLFPSSSRICLPTDKTLAFNL